MATNSLWDKCIRVFSICGERPETSSIEHVNKKIHIRCFAWLEEV